ncbi:alcohol dehydrogenase [Pseudomonas laurentiana]|nr:nucleotidyltransferase family protein [Pseudomonas laurentiana]GGU69625.1 alcohol dehydrogenase [Pseudomonas laurentiana]
MKDWRDTVVGTDATLRDAIRCIDASGLQLALMLDKDQQLVGTLSDGDVRRAILRGFSLDGPASEVMNASPITAHTTSLPAEQLKLMRRNVLHHLPLIDDQRKVVGLVTLDGIAGILERPNWVVLMAGGLGERLRPLTENCPKPMLMIAGKPILECILESFIEQGFRNFFLSVNYLASVVRDHFGDGSKWGVNICYLQEHKRLGTAGALSLLPERPQDPILVMNGDLLTHARFDNLVQFHDEHDSLATMTVREYDFQVPYGVVRMDGAAIESIDEKPVHRFFVNAGIYAISPAALDLIPPETFYDMPTLFEDLIKARKSTAAFPLREYWLDIGQIEEFERAQHEWPSQR